MGLIRRLFPPGTEAWRSLAERLGGDFIEGGFWRDDQVGFQHGKHTITLTFENDADSGSDATQLDSDLRHDPLLRIALFRNWPTQTMLTRLVSLFGFERLEVPEIGKDFALLTADPPGAKSFFGDRHLLEQIRQQPQILIAVGVPASFRKRPLPGHVSVLVPGFVNESTHVVMLLTLFQTLLDAVDGHCSNVKEGRF